MFNNSSPFNYSKVANSARTLQELNQKQEAEKNKVIAKEQREYVRDKKNEHFNSQSLELAEETLICNKEAIRVAKRSNILSFIAIGIAILSLVYTYIKG